jgi:hypothetical protein
MMIAAAVTTRVTATARVSPAKTLSSAKAFATAETLSTPEASATPEIPSSALESFGCMAAASKVKAPGAVAADTRWWGTPTKEMRTTRALRHSLGACKVLAGERRPLPERPGRLSCKLTALET